MESAVIVYTFLSSARSGEPRRSGENGESGPLGKRRRCLPEGRFSHVFIRFCSDGRTAGLSRSCGSFGSFFGASPRRTRRRSHRGRRARLRTRTRSSARPAGRVRAMPRFIKNFVCLSEGSRSTYSNGRAGGVGKRLVDVPTGATRFARHVAACRTGFDPTAPAPL